MDDPKNKSKGTLNNQMLRLCCCLHPPTEISGCVPVCSPICFLSPCFFFSHDYLW